MKLLGQKNSTQPHILQKKIAICVKIELIPLKLTKLQSIHLSALYYLKGAPYPTRSFSSIHPSETALKYSGISTVYLAHCCQHKAGLLLLAQSWSCTFSTLQPAQCVQHNEQLVCIQPRNQQSQGKTAQIFLKLFHLSPALAKRISSSAKMENLLKEV